MECVVSCMIYAAGVCGGVAIPLLFSLENSAMALISSKHWIGVSFRSGLTTGKCVNIGEDVCEHVITKHTSGPTTNPADSGHVGHGCFHARAGSDVILIFGRCFISGRCMGNGASYDISRRSLSASPLALPAFHSRFKGPLHMCVDNTAVMRIMNEGNTRSSGLVHETSATDRVLRAARINAAWSYVPSTVNPTDGVPRGCVSGDRTLLALRVRRVEDTFSPSDW
ncbi:unnamed protein product [Trypanosoma congolense IL3000]|uniref:WGS project CAEQ00000000 data, annotated contig 481 n=1 Tax=Trypanosoma congolense (strain IL3000) TaxID=1068625 RepID=F9WGA4_TRYCI|nr:unnamed protein product [Trypanosoma congolense IL3000]